MSEKCIYIVDKLVIGYNHVVFNASVVSMISSIYKDSKIIFISESVHANVIREKNGDIDNLQYQPYIELPLPAGNIPKIVPWIKKKTGDLLFIKRFYNKKLSNAQSVFFTCLSTTSLLYAAYKAKRVKMPVFFFLHGELEFIFTENISFVNKIKAGIYKRFFNQLSHTSKIFVLSDIVKAKLAEAGYITADRIITIEHPIIPVIYSEKPISENKIIFGHIGIAMKKKSSELFFKLAKHNIESIALEKVEFQLIGRVESGMVVDKNTVKIISENNKQIIQSDYEQHIADIDYAVFTFNDENYIYRVSGSVLDAITFTKPVIALKQTYFNYLFETFGNIGFLCNDFDDLAILVNRIINKDQELLKQYSTQQENLKVLRQSLTINEIKNKLSVLL